MWGRAGKALENDDCTRQALIVLSKLTDSFPCTTGETKVLLHVLDQHCIGEGARADIKIMAARYHALLQKLERDGKLVGLLNCRTCLGPLKHGEFHVLLKVFV